jgi:hypothetical protein
VRLTAIRYANMYEFTALDGESLPGYAPGAHIDLHLPNALIRQYSLVQPRADGSSYTIVVKRDPVLCRSSGCDRRGAAMLGSVDDRSNARSSGPALRSP